MPIQLNLEPKSLGENSDFLRALFGVLVCLLSPLSVVEALAAASGPYGLDARPLNATCVAPARPTSGATVTTSSAFPATTAFNRPTKLLQAPGDGSRWFVLEKAGVVRVFSVANPASVTTWIDLQSKIDGNTSEGGLLGLAFHPNFPATPEVYVSYTSEAAGGEVSSISRLILDNVTAPVAPVEQVLLTVNQPTGNHFAGDIAFGPDDYLYVSRGDGGSANYAQDNTRLLGKMLRLDVLGVAWPSPGYNLPSDNPFAGNPICGPDGNAQNCPEIFAWGFRNPWRWSFDQSTGVLWLGDVGAGQREEIDRVQRGGNYGWACFEGQLAGPYSCPASGFVSPVIEITHDNGDASVTGGFVYRGSAIPGLNGRYVFGDFVSGKVSALVDDGQGTYTNQELVDTPYNISTFGLGADGEIYLADYTGGLIHKLVAAGPGTPDTIPTDLAATGCVDPVDPTQPAVGLIPYGLNAPFWSDGAVKARHLGLPDGATITLDTNGDADLPPGSVLVKSFRLADQLVETRLFMRHPDGIWAGYTYEWNAAQTAATRVIGGKTKTINGQSWIYPSEGQCMQCHTGVAGFSLGPETAQLNGDLLYSATGRTANQLATLEHIGVFSAPLSAQPASLPKLANPTSAGQSLDDRARAYLHSNCSGCHRPGGPTPSNMDLRYGTALAATNSCDAPPQAGDLGIADARLIAPGSAGRSVLLARLNRRDIFAMPPLASNQVDSSGVSLISEWVNSLGLCNDSDADGADDSHDNCLALANPSQRDTDGDGYGNACDGDLNNDGIVNSRDLGLFKKRFLTTDPDADLNGDGIVDSLDLDLFKKMLGKPPGPTAAVHYTVVPTGKALKLNGVDQSARIENWDQTGLSLGTDDFMFAAWIKVEGATNSSFQGIFEKLGTVSPWAGMRLVLQHDPESGPQVYRLGSIIRTDTGAEKDFTTGPAITDSSWHHVAIAVDRTNGKLRYFLDGTPFGGTFDISSLTGSIANNGPFVIGQSWGPFAGTIDEVNFWRFQGGLPANLDSLVRALRDHNTVKNPHVLSRWRFDTSDAADPSSAFDSAGLNSLTLINDPVTVPADIRIYGDPPP